MTAIKDTVSSISDLPIICQHDHVLAIKGDQESGDDDYYIKFISETGTGMNKGHWEETAAPGIVNTIDNATMPQTLVREADLTFTVKPVDWLEQLSGDKETNPNPSFVGKKINDVSLFNNRLGLASDENIIMSESGNLFNFFRETVKTKLDTDRIDTASGSTKVSRIFHILPFEDNLLLFSNNTQFAVTSDGALSNDSIKVPPLVNYPCNINVPPLPVDENVYWCSESGGVSTAYELIAPNDLNSRRTNIINEHTNNLLPKNVVTLTASSSENAIVYLSTEEPNTLFVYKYWWEGSVKRQSSWEKWVFSSAIELLDVKFLKDALYIIYNDSTSTHLGKIELSQPETYDISEFSNATNRTINLTAHLDFKVSSADVVKTFDSVMGTTSVDLPYLIDPDVDVVQVVVTADTDVYQAGQLLPISGTSASTVTIIGDVTSGVDFKLGVKYTHKMTYSPFFLRNAGNGESLGSAIVDGQLVIDEMTISYSVKIYDTFA